MSYPWCFVPCKRSYDCNWSVAKICHLTDSGGISFWDQSTARSELWCGRRGSVADRWNTRALYIFTCLCLLETHYVDCSPASFTYRKGNTQLEFLESSLDASLFEDVHLQKSNLLKAVGEDCAPAGPIGLQGCIKDWNMSTIIWYSSLAGDIQKAQRYLGKAADIVKLHYGEDSTAYAHQCHKISKGRAC